MMTSKHFNELASIVMFVHKMSDKPFATPKRIADLIQEELSKFCAGENAHFDEERFIIACHKMPSRRVTTSEKEWETCVEEDCGNNVAVFSSGDFYCKKHTPTS